MYKITDYRTKKPILIREHTRIVRPYSKYGTWYERFGKWIWSWLRSPVIYTLCGIIFSSSVASAFFGGELWETYHPTNAAEAQIILMKDTQTVPPILQRIAFAETRNNQLCDADAIAHRLCPSYENGEVLETTNANKSVDIGAYAINNAAYGAKAVQLGYDIYTADGNKAMAEWIFNNEGTEPWYSSESRWK